MSKASTFGKLFCAGLMAATLLACQANSNPTQVDATPAAQTQSVSATRDGQPVIERGKIVRVWDQQLARWSSVESFWRQYGQRSGGKHWGQSIDYPAYADVNELDTFMVELPSGVCLMEFWHSRWRRANDVRRWHPAFNEHSACADVFK